jgi:hypothetical protein
VCIGQTDWSIDSWCKEHEHNICLYQLDKSTVAEHSTESGHSIKIHETEVLAKTSGYMDPLVKYTKEIKLQPEIQREESFKLSNAWNHSSSLLRHSNILSHVKIVTIRGVLDWMSGLIDTLLHTTQYYMQLQRYRCIYTLYSSPLHTHTLGFSVFTSHILETDL